MAQTITVGIDIGTSTVKVVVAELVRTREKPFPKIIATGIAETRGLRHGYITSSADVVRSIRLAVRQAEKAANTTISRAYLSISGVGVTGTVCLGSSIVSRGDSEITDLDVTKVLEACENELPSSFSLNRKVIHSIPISFKIDGKTVLGRPQGMKGMKLEARTLFITCIEQHLTDMIQAVGDAGIEVDDVMAGPLAASLITLSKTQKIAGCIIANIGAETISIATYENNIPISLEVFALGSTDITHDLALGLKVSLEEAELLKIGGQSTVSVSRKKLDEIIDARLTDIFELIDSHLKRIGRNGLLPAGIILTGGGAAIDGIEEAAKDSLRLPAKVPSISFEADTHGFSSSTWTTAYGLCILGFTQGDERPPGFGKVIKTKNTIMALIKQFLP